MKDQILYYWQTVVKPAKEAKEAEAKKKPMVGAFKNGAPVLCARQEKAPAGLGRGVIR
jgi:hypothetical protein